MPLEFEWDERKNRSNIQDHGISFKHAAQMFNGRVVEWEDDRWDYGETRMIGIGKVEGRFLRVTFTRREHRIRIISAKKADSHERRKYRRKFETLHI